MTTPQPLVSVVLPVYNGATFLAEAIDSVLAQTYPNIEVIVVDDGSTDRGATAEVIRSFGSQIRAIHKPNGGVATAINRGIEEMKGELFSWLSHDDRYEPEKIAVQVETWRRHGPDCVVVGDYDVIDEHGAPVFEVRIETHNLHARPLDGVFQAALNGCAMLIPREAFNLAGVFAPGLPVTQDYELWFRMARVMPFVRSPGSLVRYRSHPAQGSRQHLHLEQVNRLIAYFADATSLDEMMAYDGSPIRFLRRLQLQWRTYCSACTFIDGRIAVLLGAMPFAAVILGDRSGDAAETARELTAGSPAPTILLHLPEPDSAPDATLDWAAQAELAAQAPADIILIVSAENDRAAAAVLPALEALAEGADIARPSDHANRRSPLDGLIIRRRALPLLYSALSTGNPGLPGLAVASYPVPIGPETDDNLVAALEGRQMLAFRDRPNRTARVIRRHLEAFLPTILLLGRHDDDRSVHTRALAAALDRRANCILLCGDDDGYVWLSLSGKGGGLRFDLPRQFDDLVALLQAIGVVRVDVHHTLGFEEAAELLLDRLGVPYDLTLTDNHFITPEEEIATASPLLMNAQRIIAVSRALARDTSLLHPALPVVCARPLIRQAVNPQHVFMPRIWNGEALRVLVPGTITSAQGRDVILATARLVSERHLPIKFHIVGTIRLPFTEWAALKDVVILHSSADGGDFSDTVIKLGPHVAWFPTQTPEANLYALTRVIGLCFPIAAGAIGSIPDRCEARPLTWLLPWNSDATAWVTLFLTLHASKLRTAPHRAEIGELPQAQPNFYPDDYIAPVRACYGIPSPDHSERGLPHPPDAFQTQT